MHSAFIRYPFPQAISYRKIHLYIILGNWSQTHLTFFRLIPSGTLSSLDTIVYASARISLKKNLASVLLWYAFCIFHSLNSFPTLSLYPYHFDLISLNFTFSAYSLIIPFHILLQFPPLSNESILLPQSTVFCPFGYSKSHTLF